MLTSGGSLSATVTVCEQVTLLLLRSVTCQVRVATNAWPQVGLVAVFRIFRLALQLSPNAGSSKDQARPASTVLFEAQVITGGCVSRTITFWTQVVRLPLRSRT